MPEEKTKRRARQAARQGKSPSTQAGEFVREEIAHLRQGKHGARSTKQVIAIGLSKARRAGVPLKPPRRGATKQTTKRALRDYRKGQSGDRQRPSVRRSLATRRALRREGSTAGSKAALARFARATAARRSPAIRRRSSMQAVRTKGRAGRQAAARKAARTRARRG